MAKLAKFLQGVAGAAGGEALNVEDVFSTYLYEGNASTQTITNGIDLSGEGGLVWAKIRDTASTNHMLVDTERGVSKAQRTNFAAAEQTGTFLSSFNSNGFTLANNFDMNGSGYDIASWTFRKAPKFFDVVTYTGNLTARTISHNLDSVPGTIIIKKTSGSGSWYIYHRSLGNTAQLKFDNGSQDTGVSTWNSTTPTDTEFSLGAVSSVNRNGDSYVAYLFAHNDGDGDFGPDGDADIIKCGSYTGNGSSNGPEIDLGFEPQWILLKGASAASSWILYDTMRGMTVGTTNAGPDANLYPHSSAAEYTDYHLSPTPTGFQIRDTGGNTNTNGDTYIYIAIRRGPMAVPTDATDVFDVNTYNATGSSGNPQTTGFPVDLAIIGQRQDTDSWKHGVLTRLTGAVNYLVTSSSSGEQNAGGGINIDNMTGYDFQSGAFNTASPAGMYNLNWRRAPSFFDVVAYTGDNSYTTINHNLGVPPELIITKTRSISNDWEVEVKDTSGSFKRLYLNSSAGAGTLAQQPVATNTTHTFGIAQGVYPFIAYLFASVDGVSKVGSYTGNGSTSVINVDCGFSAGARFVLIKRTDASGDWYVFDTERGIYDNVTDDPYLLLNNTDAEVTATNYLTTYSSGFGISTYGGSPINASGGSYIFYAIA